MKLFGNSHKKENNKPQKEKKSKMSPGLRTLLIILIVLFAIVVAAVVFLKFYIQPPTLPTNAAVSAKETANSTSQPEKDGKDKIYSILLAGTDGDDTRTDTIMLAFVNTTKHTLSFVSIPRDTLIDAPLSVPKLNGVYGANGCGKEGMEALMLEVEKIVGFMPAGYILIKLDAFKEMVDVLGGVTFNVPERMYYDDPTQDLHIDLQPGEQFLDGNKAEQLVRYRSYKNGQADIERTKTQQAFMRAIAKKCLESLDLTKIDDYCSVFKRNVTTNFSLSNLLFFAKELALCDMDSIQSETLIGEPVWIGDGSYYRLDDENTKKVMDRMLNRVPETTNEQKEVSQ